MEWKGVRKNGERDEITEEGTEGVVGGGGGGRDSLIGLFFSARHTKKPAESSQGHLRIITSHSMKNLAFHN